MRVIAGSRRSIRLCTVKGRQVRPTTDRIKETLFNILQPYLPGCSFLDLFSGSGAIGIEALSRGAKEAVLVESDRAALACIHENLRATRFEEAACVKAGDVLTVLAGFLHEPFDVVFMDPPYRMGWEEKVLSLLAASGLADDDTLVVVEAAAQTAFDFAEGLGFFVERVKSYGSNQHVFLRRGKPPSA